MAFAAVERRADQASRASRAPPTQLGRLHGHRLEKRVSICPGRIDVVLVGRDDVVVRI
jgi:hypothetical protein